MAMSQSYLQMLLAQDPDFLRRLQYLMVQTARVVQEEDPTTENHQQRARYASQVISQPQSMSMQAATLVVGGPNMVGKTTLEDVGPVTTANDAEIFSQINAYWNVLAGQAL